MKVPCGCGNRKEIMFTQGNPDKVVIMIAGAAILGLAVAILVKKG